MFEYALFSVTGPWVTLDSHTPARFSLVHTTLREVGASLRQINNCCWVHSGIFLLPLCGESLQGVCPGGELVADVGIHCFNLSTHCDMAVPMGSFVFCFSY